MDFYSSHRLSLDRDKKQKHNIDLTLDLELDNLMNVDDIADEIVTNEQGLRSRVFHTLSTQVIPGISESAQNNLNLESETPGHTKFNSNNSSEWSARSREICSPSGTVLDFKSTSDISMAIETNRPTNGLQAFTVARGGLASLITDDVLMHLKSKYLGVNSQKVSSEWKINDDETSINSQLMAA